MPGANESSGGAVSVISKPMVALQDSRFCRHLTPKEQQSIGQLAVLRRVATGSVIFHEGEEGDGLYVVNSGRVQIAASSTPDHAHVLSRMEPGDYFGEMSIFDGGTRSATAVALEDCDLSFVPTEAVLALLGESPLLAAALVRDASLRMREFNRRFLQESLKAERLQLVERFARSIVHDFRNPLNVIGIAADLAAEAGASPDARRSARDRIRKQIEVLNRMMQELLDFTRAVATDVVLPKVNYTDFLQDILFELRSEAARRGVELVIEGPMPAVSLRLDPPRLTRVFTNLYANAFDAMSGRDDARLTLRFAVDDAWVTTELSDNGHGIPAEHLRHLFEPFFTFGKSHGTGLGLAICERIVKEHGGTIIAESTPNRGAVFRFRLPVPKPGDTDTVVR